MPKALFTVTSRSDKDADGDEIGHVTFNINDNVLNDALLTRDAKEFIWDMATQFAVHIYNLYPDKTGEIRANKATELISIKL